MNYEMIICFDCKLLKFKVTSNKLEEINVVHQKIQYLALKCSGEEPT